MADKPVASLMFKLSCLSAMVLLVAVHAIALRYTRTTLSDMYFPTTAVFMAEVFKLILSLGMLAIETGSRLKVSVVEHVFRSPKQLLMIAVPSVFFAAQNNMVIVALSNLSVAVFQVTCQLKIVVTAVCTVVMLGRSLSHTQWFSIFMLCEGVILTQWNRAQDTTVHTEQNAFLGYVAIAIVILCSGFASVYFEKVLRSSDTSLWVRNVQMYLSAIVVTFAGVFVADGEKVFSKGFFFGYTPWVWFVIFLASSKGVLMSVVVKYTDTIVRNLGTTAATLLSTVASVYLFGLQITSSFICGALLVCVSVCLYGLPKKDTSALQDQEFTQTRPHWTLDSKFGKQQRRLDLTDV